MGGHWRQSDMNVCLQCTAVGYQCSLLSREKAQPFTVSLRMLGMAATRTASQARLERALSHLRVPLLVTKHSLHQMPWRLELRSFLQFLKFIMQRASLRRICIDLELIFLQATRALPKQLRRAQHSTVLMARCQLHVATAAL